MALLDGKLSTQLIGPYLVIKCGTIITQGYQGSVEGASTTETSNYSTWLPPHSQSGAIKLAPPLLTLVKIYYSVIRFNSLFDLIRYPFLDLQPMSMQMRHVITPLPWPMMRSHTNLVPETLATSPGT